MLNDTETDTLFRYINENNNNNNNREHRKQQQQARENINVQSKNIRIFPQNEEHK